MKRRYWLYCTTLLLALLFFFQPLKTDAAGWKYQNKNWFYYTSSGQKKTGFFTYKGKQYYCNSQGVMLTGLRTINKKTYYFNKPDGHMETKWIRLGTSWYYFYASTGKGYAATGKVKISGKYYYFNSKGVMLTGWQTISKKRYYFHKTDGCMVKNQWIGTNYVNASGTIAKAMPTSYSLNTKVLLQNPELPTGCESVALTAVLKYHKFSLSKTTIADYYLTYSNTNFVSSFVGNPYSTNGAGCYAPGIADAANRYLIANKSPLRAKDITGTPLSQIYHYISEKKPVLIWNSMYMRTPFSRGEFYTYQGKSYPWYVYEHCVVLCGYDTKSKTLTINDPLEGIVTRSMSSFESIYNLMGQMAVVIE